MHHYVKINQNIPPSNPPTVGADGMGSRRHGGGGQTTQGGMQTAQGKTARGQAIQGDTNPCLYYYIFHSEPYLHPRITSN